MATVTRENPGIGKFKVAGKELEIRHATMNDLGKVIQLINSETYYSHFQQSLANLVRPDHPINEHIKTAVASGTVDKKAYSHLRRFAEGMVEEQSTTVSLDFTNARDIARAIKDKASIVAVMDNSVVGHMCSYSLEEFTGDRKLREITHGVLHWNYRDGRDIPMQERKNIQNRTRYATLHNAAMTCEPGTTIISITRQDLVAVPLEPGSGFQRLRLGTDIGDYILSSLTPAVWSESWIARYCTVDNWIKHCRVNGINNIDEYNNYIADANERQKKANNT
ncbi:MAG: hypothetical protein KGH66_03170 [Candidatus Micrarchaeota archaeon]|nr:hypothetical protein [Candidatus Micrarchaeota archaeon]